MDLLEILPATKARRSLRKYPVLFGSLVGWKHHRSVLFGSMLGQWTGRLALALKPYYSLSPASKESSVAMSCSMDLLDVLRVLACGHDEAAVPDLRWSESSPDEGSGDSAWRWEDEEGDILLSLQERVF
jgi:hypothetical protein